MDRDVALRLYRRGRQVGGGMGENRREWEVMGLG